MDLRQRQLVTTTEVKSLLGSKIAHNYKTKLNMKIALYGENDER